MEQSKKKRIIITTISYTIYFIFFFLFVFYGYKVSRSFRNISYYNNEVFKHYTKANSTSPTGYEDEEFIKKLTGQFNSFYSKKEIYSFTNDDYLKKIVIDFKIYPFYRKKAKFGKGVMIYINKLKLLDEKNNIIDLMGRDRLSPNDYKPKVKLYISFDFKNNIDDSKNILLDPFKPFIFTENDILKNNELRGIKIHLNKIENLIILANEKSKFKNENAIHTKKDILLTENEYIIKNIDYNNLTQQNILDHKIINYTTNYYNYNKVIIITELIIGLIFIIIGYFSFIHIYLYRFLKDKIKKGTVKK